jgi:hypothetical protein
MVGCTLWSTTVSSSADSVSKVDLLAQARAEGLDGLGRVVAASVEASVNGPLDAMASWLEQRGCRQGGAGHGPARRIPSHAAKPLPKDQHDPGIDTPSSAVSSP